MKYKIPTTELEPTSVTTPELAHEPASEPPPEPGPKLAPKPAPNQKVFDTPKTKRKLTPLKLRENFLNEMKYDYIIMDVLFDGQINFSLLFNYCDKLIFFRKIPLLYIICMLLF